MFCKECGNKISKEEKFCGSCGCKNAGVNLEKEVNQLQHQPQVAEEQTKKSNKKFVIIGAVCVGVGIIAASATLVFFNMNRIKKLNKAKNNVTDTAMQEDGKGGKIEQEIVPENPQTDNSNNKGEVVTEQQKIDDIVKEVLGLEYIANSKNDLNYCRSTDGVVSTTEIKKNGFFFAKSLDLDHDTKEEILVGVLKYDESKEMTTCKYPDGPNSLKLCVLEQGEDEAWNLADSAYCPADESKSFINHTSTSDMLDFFVQENSTGMSIFIEDNGYNYLFSDGLNWFLEEFRYSDGTLQNIKHNNTLAYSGSSELEPYQNLDPSASYYEDDVYAEEFVKEFRKLGFDVDNIGLGKTIMEQDSSLVKLARIRVNNNIKGENASKWYNNTVEPTLSGTWTTFYDLVGNIEEIPDYQSDVYAEPWASEESAESNTNISSEYIFSDSNTRVLSSAEVQNLTYDEVRTAINEIYARHGRKFKDTQLQAYFDKQSWYTGTIEPEDFSESMLNAIEKQNVELLSEIKDGFK